MDNVSKEEYNAHKVNCSSSFDEIKAQLEILNIAMFGHKETKKLGVLDMVTEMYDLFKSGNITFKAIKYVGIFISFVVALILGITKLIKGS